MSSPNERLRQAREKHFDSAGAAADAMGIPRGTYAGHENGHRGFPAGRAPLYARRFKVSEEWLLYGKGEPANDDTPNEDDLERMIEAALRELPVGVTIGDLPRYVAPSLRGQLERYRVDRGSSGSAAETSALGKGAQSPQPTKQSSRGASRTT